MAHGDVVNTASRLQSGAQADGILVDERTYRATRFQISFRPEPPLLRRARPSRCRCGRWSHRAVAVGTDRCSPRSAPLVGRAHEVEC